MRLDMTGEERKAARDSANQCRHGQRRLVNMRKKSIILLLVAGVGAILPVFNVLVVPEWTFSLVDERNDPIINTRVDQRWLDYSLEFWRSSEHVDHTVASDANGNVQFPARTIRVSGIQILAAEIRDVVARIDPNAGYGPHAYVLCLDSVDCSATFRPGEQLPKIVEGKK